MKMFTNSGHYTLLYGSSAGATYFDVHFIVTLETVKIIFNLASVRPKLHSTSAAVEMISMIWFALKIELNLIELGVSTYSNAIIEQIRC